VCLSEEYGGSGGGLADACLFLEETSYGMVPAGGFVTTVIAAKAYERFGSERQRRAVLTGVVNGDVLSIAMSEPGAGSDVGALRCRARRAADGTWVIEGQKTWISNAHHARSILLVARTGEDKHGGLTMFHLPADAPGVKVRGIETLGGREVNDLFLTGVRLPADAVVGRVDDGWRQLMAGLNHERLFLASNMLGLARRAFDDALAGATRAGRSARRGARPALGRGPRSRAGLPRSR
jgi:alkylation response protein AidB-like acyl-CoA dehydrogenase